jgi:hypothetical protein
MDGLSEMVENPAETPAATDPVQEGNKSPCPPPTPRAPSLTLNDIYLLARRKWNAAGRPTGDSIRFWLEAEQELRQPK